MTVEYQFLKCCCHYRGGFLAKMQLDYPDFLHFKQSLTSNVAPFQIKTCL